MINARGSQASANEVKDELTSAEDSIPADAGSDLLPDLQEIMFLNLHLASGISKESLSMLMNNDHFNHQY